MTIFPIVFSYLFTIIFFFFYLIGKTENFMKEYKQNLPEILNRLSSHNIQKVDNRHRIKEQFKKLKSIPITSSKIFEDFLKIDNTIYFEVEVYTLGDKNKKNNHHNYSCLVLQNHNNSNFHIISKHSSFRTSSQIEYSKRFAKLSSIYYKKYWLIISIFLKPFFSILYFPLFKYFELAKVKEKMIKNGFNYEIGIGKKMKTKRTSFNIVFSFVIYTAFLTTLIVNILSSFISLESLKIGLFGSVLFFSLLPIGVASIAAFFLKDIIEKKYKNIELDNTMFNKNFDIHTTDDIESFNFLSPSNIEKLLLVNNKRNISIETTNDFIFIILEKRKNMFEWKNLNTLDDLVKFHLFELNEIIEIKNEFKFSL